MRAALWDFASVVYKVVTVARVGPRGTMEPGAWVFREVQDVAT